MFSYLPHSALNTNEIFSIVVAVLAATVLALSFFDRFRGLYLRNGALTGIKPSELINAGLAAVTELLAFMSLVTGVAAIASIIALCGYVTVVSATRFQKWDEEGGSAVIADDGFIRDLSVIAVLVVLTVLMFSLRFMSVL